MYKGSNDFKKGHKPRTNILKDENGDMVADSHSVSSRWRNYFSQLLNVRGVNDVRQREIHTAEPLVPEQSAFETELATENLKRHKSPAIDQIPAELIKQGIQQFAMRSINLFLFGIRRSYFRSGSSWSFPYL